MKKILFIILFVLISSNAWSAIVYDAYSSDDSGWASSLTFSHTVADEDDRLMIVQGLANAGKDVTGVTFNGDSFTQVETAGDWHSNSQWYLLNPDVGTHDVVVTYNSAEIIEANAMSFYGVKQQAPEATILKNGTSPTPDEDISTVTDNALVIDTLAALESLVSVNEDQTEIYNNTDRVNFDAVGSTKLVPTAGVTNMGYTLDTNAQYTMIISVWEEAGAAVTYIQ